MATRFKERMITKWLSYDLWITTARLEELMTLSKIWNFWHFWNAYRGCEDSSVSKVLPSRSEAVSVIPAHPHNGSVSVITAEGGKFQKLAGPPASSNQWAPSPWAILLAPWKTRGGWWGKILRSSNPYHLWANTHAHSCVHRRHECSCMDTQ